MSGFVLTAAVGSACTTPRGWLRSPCARHSRPSASCRAMMLMIRVGEKAHKAARDRVLISAIMSSKCIVAIGELVT